MQRAPLSMASRSAVKAEAWLEEQAQDTEHRRNPHHHHHSNHHHHGRSQLHTHNHTLHSRSGHTPRFADEDEDADADMMGSLLRGKLTETSAYSSWADGAVHEAQTAVARAHLDNLCGVCGAARPEDPQAPFCSVCGSQLPPLPLFLKDDAAKCPFCSSPLKPAARFCYACENKVPAKFWERLHGQNRTAAPHNHHHHGDTLRTAQPQEQPDSFHLSHPLSHNGHHGQHTLSHTASLQASLSRDAHLAGMNPIHSRETNMTQKLSPKTCIKCGCENSPVLTHCSRCEAVLPVLQGSVHLHQPQCARTA
eukprot:m.318829 g.318829  ORF g.318829 m.318829 type:complete len:308 (+) comp23086_c2_seq43:455-1378(+)